MTESIDDFDIDDLDAMTELLCKEYKEAREDYIRKRTAKGLEIDERKLSLAISKRKRIHLMTRKCLAITFNLGNAIMQKPAIQEVANDLWSGQ